MLDMIELQLPDSLQHDDDILYQLCRRNQNLRIERTAKGELLLMSPAGSETDMYNADLIADLKIWTRRTGLGHAFGSSAGFRLPDGAMRNPDAAWISSERWNQLTPVQRATFSPICPDFVIELMSPSDRVKDAQEKMDEWMANGCRLGWLIDRQNELVYIYRANGQSSVVKSFDENLSGEDVMPGFVLELKELR